MVAQKGLKLAQAMRALRLGKRPKPCASHLRMLKSWSHRVDIRLRPRYAVWLLEQRRRVAALLRVSNALLLLLL